MVLGSDSGTQYCLGCEQTANFGNVPPINCSEDLCIHSLVRPDQVSNFLSNASSTFSLHVRE